jgi:hypothetical protein
MMVLSTQVFGQEIIDTTKKTALGVNPAIMEVVLDEKKPTVKEITLYNLTNFPVPIKTTVESFTPKEKLEIPKDQLNRFDASSWIEINNEDGDFILQPREAKIIELTVTQPKKAAPGGYYASVVFQPLIPQSLVSNESIFIFARVATLAFLQVKGEVKENLEFKTFKINNFYQSLPESFTFILRNTGNTHLRPQGKIIINDEIRKKTVRQIGFLPSIILPGTEKEYKADLSDLRLTMGKFSVLAETSYGTENSLIKSSKYYFYVFPYTISALAFISLIIFLTLIIKIKSRLKKALNVLILGEKALRRRHLIETDKIKIKRLKVNKE